MQLTDLERLERLLLLNPLPGDWILYFIPIGYLIAFFIGFFLIFGKSN